MTKSEVLKQIRNDQGRLNDLIRAYWNGDDPRKTDDGQALARLVELAKKGAGDEA